MNIEDYEWFSNCCNASPLNELHYEDNFTEPGNEPIGRCEECGDGAIFYIKEWEDDSYV